MLSKDTQECFSLTFFHNEVSSNPFLEPLQRGWRSLLLPQRTGFIVVNKPANSKTFCCLTKSYYFFVSKVGFFFFVGFGVFFFHIVSIFSFFHMASIFKILQSTFREKFLPSSQPLQKATVCIFDDKKKKIEQGNEFMCCLIFLLDECRQETITLLCSPSRACS